MDEILKPEAYRGLSPEHWRVDIRRKAEEQEEAGWTATNNRIVAGNNGIVCATASPIAVQSGLFTLQSGGTAADAAATIALTQVATHLGSTVSYAGILSLVYYDSNEKQVYSMDAGFNSYLRENDPGSIPCNNDGLLAKIKVERADGVALDGVQKENGRKTLVPGFVAGIKAMHQRFGCLPFEDLFAPAIWYADKGIVINHVLGYYFQAKQEFLSQTAEGRDFLRQAENDLPQSGDLFRQPVLAKTLASIAKRGINYFYKGAWAEHFVEVVQREGGNVSKEDLQNYEVIWSEPRSTSVFGHTVFCPGAPNEIAYKLFPSLHLAETLELERRADYWNDPLVLRDLQRIFDLTDLAPFILPPTKALFESKNVDCTADAQLSKQYAQAVAPLLDQLCVFSSASNPRHSDCIVVVDKMGNIAALTHTINTVIWGDTGIIVDGIPIPNPAGFQQQRLAGIKCGERLPHEMAQTICFKGENPVLATAAIGMSLIPETVKVILCALGKSLNLQTIQGSAPLLCNFQHLNLSKSVSDRGIIVPKHLYNDNFLNQLAGHVSRVHKIDERETNVLRGTVAAVITDPDKNEKLSVETAGVLLFASAY